MKWCEILERIRAGKGVVLMLDISGQIGYKRLRE